jgi:PAS domain S-box-containing protein
MELTTGETRLRGFRHDADLHDRLDRWQAAQRALLDNLPDATVVMCDTDLRVVDASSDYAHAVGHRLDRLLADRPELLALHRAALAGEEQWAEQLLCRDGREHTLRVVPLRRHGVIYGLIAIAQDVTERARHDRELRRAKDEFEAAFEYAAVGMALVGLDGRWLRVNETLCGLLGYTPEELLATTFQELTHPDDLEADLAYCAQLLAGEIDTYSLEKRYFTKSGALLSAVLSVSLVRDADGAPVHYVSQIRDHRPELRRRELQAELAERRRADSLTVLAGGVAHDFNNLLVGVLGHASLALAHVPEDGKAHASLREIEATARTLADLTDQMLAFSGKTWLEPAPLSLAEHARKAYAAVEDELPDDIVVHWSLAPDAPDVDADATHLLRVTSNLLMNAAEATSAGSVVSIATGGVHLTRATLDSYAIGREAEPGLYGFVEVSDAGVGMDGDTQARMFEPFFTTKFPGRGLGLASVDGLIRAHRGALVVDTAPGAGTRVRVLLPAAA